MRIPMLIAVAATALAACADEQPRAPSAPPIAIGVAMPGTHSLWAGNPTGGGAVRLAPVRRGMDPGDVCLRIGFEGRAGSVYCAVRDRRGGVAELRARVGPRVSVVAGQAGAAVRKLLLEVEGESHQLPLSRERAFLALLPASYRGEVALIARKGNGTVATRTFAAR